MYCCFHSPCCNADEIEQTGPHVASCLPALVYGTAFIHWELDFFFFCQNCHFYNKHLYK